MKRRIVLSILATIVILTVIFVITFQSKKCNEPIITFTFDDGYKDQYNTAFPLFKKYNITATTYIITGLVGNKFENETLMDWNEIKELKNEGWEIGSHTVTHQDLTKLNKDDINNELKKSKQKLEEQNVVARSISIPYGKYNEEIRDIAQEHYESIRPSEWGKNKFSSIKKYNLKSLWLTNTTQRDEIKLWIDETESEKSWAIIIIHHVRINQSREYTTHPDDLNKVIEYIKEKEIKVKTVSEVLDQCD